jgi:hypothetical protein
VTPASVVLAALLASWGPVWPAPAAPENGAAEPAAATAPEAAPPPTAPTDVKPPAPAAPPVVPIVPPAIIARGPIDVRARPPLVAAPRKAHEPQKPLHKQWAFWAIAGGLFVGAVTAVVIATRPGPDPYRGNTSPYYVPFP